MFDPYECLGLHCSLTHRAFTAIFEKRLKDTGVSPAQFYASRRGQTLMRPERMEHPLNGRPGGPVHSSGIG